MNLSAPETLLTDPRVRLTLGESRPIRATGLQPFILCTGTGTLVVQSQLPQKPFPSSRQTFQYAIGTDVSRDEGASWTTLPLEPGDNGLNMEGGAIQLRDGTIMALDTFVTPGKTPGTGVGLLYSSRDDWRTVQGPEEITFALPGVRFYGSSDDSGLAHVALRLHRRILELPNGDLLTTLYGWFEGDNTPVDYMPTMHKVRVVLLRSKNRGRHWDMVSIVAIGSKFGTEGVGEAVLARLSAGPRAGRLICQMRTGRELRECCSDDEGRTWSPAIPRVYADLDVYRTDKWVEMFRGIKDKHGNLIENNPVELIGAVVDPDLLELRSGVLVASFGVRVPPRSCWPHAHHPWNGSYLAVSLDQGVTWSHIVRVTSGILTTHYTAIEETPQDNRIFFVHDLGDWNSGLPRSTHGRYVQINVGPKSIPRLILPSPAEVRAKNHPMRPNTPETLLSDSRLRLTFGEERLVIEGGLQPSMLATKSGALIVQSQLPEKPIPTKRMVYHSAMGTVISRDEGATWTRLPLKPGENGLNMEGGAIQLRDGSILALDTFVTPGKQPDLAEGQLYYSTDDWRTLAGPVDITFTVPGVKFIGSTDDGGSPHPAVRLHRRILELPNGDLLTTLYGWFEGDNVPVGYMPTMHKTRVVLLRSTNRGLHWTMVSVVAAKPAAETEGFGEGVLARVGVGPRAGRLICQMRTGWELHEAISDDDGRTWSPPRPRVYADLDVYRTEKWVELFRGVKDKHGKLIADNPFELIGAVVDPDLLELRSGVLVATFGVRVPPRACWPRAEHPWNGNYLAVSLDHGTTWSHVVRMTSGVLTTHYMAIEALPGENRLYVTYDLGDWSSQQGRATYGRTLQLAVSRS